MKKLGYIPLKILSNKALGFCVVNCRYVNGFEENDFAHSEATLMIIPQFRQGPGKVNQAIKNIEMLSLS